MGDAGEDAGEAKTLKVSMAPTEAPSNLSIVLGVLRGVPSLQQLALVPLHNSAKQWQHC